MNELQILNNAEFGELRTIEENGKLLFCGGDVASALGYVNPRKALTDHCRCVTKRDVPHPQSPDKQIEMSFIPEGDVYRLICHSKLDSAERFERWVFDEVLPSIRKHGAYLTTETAEKIMSDPDNWIKLLTALKDERAKTAALTASDAEKTAEIDRLHDDLDSERRRTMKCAIQATFFEAVMDKGDNITLTEAAKEIGCGRDQLIDLCLRKRYLYRAKSGRLLPMANRKAASVFTVKEYQYKGGYQLQPQTYVTLPGRAKLLAECVKDGIVKPTLPDPLATFWEV